MMHDKKWKHHRLSKRLYPTRIISTGTSGSLVVGKIAARQALKKMLGRDISHMRETDTRTEWVFLEPIRAN